jgi:hypothetical protein
VSKKAPKTVSEKAFNTVLRAADNLDEAIESVEKTVAEKVRPFRKNGLQRFPVVFLLAVTFGVIATEFGLQLLLLKYTFLTDKPGIIFTVGVITLILTGVAYKKAS